MKKSVYTRPQKPFSVTPRPKIFTDIPKQEAQSQPLIVHADTDCFVTPPEVATRMADYANIESGFSVFDPSAGVGNLIRAVLDTQEEGITLLANELNLDLYNVLTERFNDENITATQGDFLKITDLRLNRIIMNPPFRKRQAYKHIEHAKKLLASNGFIIALVPSNFEVSGMYEIETLPSGTFEHTAIETKIIEIAK